jgi:hypothetical protein
MLLERLDDETHKAWELKTASYQEMASLDDILTFLENRCKALKLFGTLQGGKHSQAVKKSKVSKQTASFNIVTQGGCRMLSRESLSLQVREISGDATQITSHICETSSRMFYLFETIQPFTCVFNICLSEVQQEASHVVAHGLHFQAEKQEAAKFTIKGVHSR